MDLDSLIAAHEGAELGAPEMQALATLLLVREQARTADLLDAVREELCGIRTHLEASPAPLDAEMVAGVVGRAMADAAPKKRGKEA